MFKHIAIATAALLVGTSAYAQSQGSFGFYPSVGNPATSAGTTGTGSTSSGTIPAGPAAITGSETIPADTNLPQGQSPQTVTIPAKVLISGRVTQYVTPTSGQTVTATPQTTLTDLTPAGTLAALTVVFPANAGTGQTYKLFSSQTITALTLTPATGQTIVGGVTTLAANSSVEYVYNAATATWSRSQ